MMHSREVIDLRHPCLAIHALGDRCVWILGLLEYQRLINKELWIIPPEDHVLVQLCNICFNGRVGAIPNNWDDAQVLILDESSHRRAQGAWNVWDSICQHLGYMEPVRNMPTHSFIPFGNSPQPAVLIYPQEGTRGNQLFNGPWWETCIKQLKDRGFLVYGLLEPNHHLLRKSNLAALCDTVRTPTLENLAELVSMSTLAIGTSTGPSWYCMLSEIPQICIEGVRPSPAYWRFDHCCPVLSKSIAWCSASNFYSVLDQIAPKILPRASLSDPAVLTLDTLAQKYGTDKRSGEHGYTQYYERHIGNRRNSPVSLLELGIGRGQSLNMWRDYFPSGHIVGVDANPSSIIYDTRITSYHGDATSITLRDKIQNDNSNGFDIIVDDCSHMSRDTAVSLELYWPLLKSGGVYVIEDLHCSYRFEYVREARPIMDILYLMLDDLNLHGETFNMDRSLRSKVGRSLRWQEKQVYGMYFYAGICFIERTAD